MAAYLMAVTESGRVDLVEHVCALAPETMLKMSTYVRMAIEANNLDMASALIDQDFYVDTVSVETFIHHHRHSDDQQLHSVLKAMCQTEHRSLLRGVIEFSIDKNIQWAIPILIDHADKSNLFDATRWVASQMAWRESEDMYPHLDMLYNKLDLIDETDDFLNTCFDHSAHTRFWTHHRSQQQKRLLQQELTDIHPTLPSKRHLKM